jgi:hypothetical protein
MEETLRQLMEESYGALGWLQGLVQLSDRARAYKVKKLQEALAAAEACLLTPIAGDGAVCPECGGEMTKVDTCPRCGLTEAPPRA